MVWVYLSPHFDDAAYSCGGLIWEQTRAGERVEIWTICAGTPPQGLLSPFAAAIHERWGTGLDAVDARREEDQEACQILGAVQRLFEIPDCIYRFLPDGSPVIVNNEDLFTAPLEREAELVQNLTERLRAVLPAGARLVSPLTLGGHVDHRLARAAAEGSDLPLEYYADFPYGWREQPDIERWLPPGAAAWDRPISMQGLDAWQRAVAAYRSQVSTFWADEAALRAEMEAYWRSTGCMGRLWGLHSHEAPAS